MFSHLDDDVPFHVSDEFAGTVLRSARRHRRRRNAARSAAVAVGAVAILGGVVATRIDDIERVEVATTPAPPAGEPVNVLLLGLDTGIDGRTTTDSTDVIVVARVEPADHSVRLLWIPRDLYLDGDPAMKASLLPTGDVASSFVSMVESRFAIPIHHVAMLDMSSFIELIDVWGGIEANVSADLQDRSTGLDVSAGCRHLDGAEALALVRSRHLTFRTDGGGWESDATGDVGRVQLQVALAQVVATRLRTDAPGPVELLGLAEQFADDATVDDDFSVTEMVRLVTELRTAESFSTRVLPTAPATGSPGMSVLEFTGTPDEARSLLYDEVPVGLAAATTVPLGIPAVPVPAITPC